MDITLIVESNNLFTGENGHTQSGAFAVSGEEIVACGTRDEVHAFAQENNSSGHEPTLVDFGDSLVVPGFHDSHLHFFHSAVYSSPLATTFMGENELDCIRRLQEFAQQRPEGWLLAQGWREYRWDPPILPSKHSLDEAFPTRPVAVYSGDAHTLWLNSVALNELGLHNASIAPQGGSYDRDSAGELTGIVRESAAMELMPVIMGSFSDDEIASAYLGFFESLAKNGVTSVCDMSLMAHPGLDFIRDDIHARLLSEEKLTARVQLFPTLLDSTGRFEDMQQAYTGSKLKAAGFKQFFDGVSSQHTAWVTEPYTNAHDENDCGRPTIDPETMRSYILAAAKKGYPVRIHTIGDAAIHAALNYFEEEQSIFGKLPHGRKHCLEHVENFLPEDMKRLHELDVIAAVQPPHITLDPGGPERDLGLQRAAYMWPLATLLEQGTTLAFGTDSPVVSVNSLNVLYSATTRQDPHTHLPRGGWLTSERITMAQAIQAYTQGSAAAASRQHELGTLAPGMLADFCVIDTNLLECTEGEIQSAAIQATYMGGRCVYRASLT